MTKTVNIIGAGFSGLSLAVRLVDSDCRVKIFDKNAKPGGLIDTIPMKHSFAEAAANSLIRTERMEQFVQHLGLEPLLTAKLAKKRFIYRDGLRRWPLNFGETAGAIIKASKAKLRRDLPPRSQETLHQWGERVCGKPAAHFLLETAMQGIYAGDPMDLSASLILGSSFRSREKYRGTFSFEKGMASLIQGMESYLRSKGAEFCLGSLVDLPPAEETTVIATDAHAAAHLLSKQPAGAILKQIEMLPILTITCSLSNSKAAKGFGCLFPRSSGLRALGVLFPSSMYDRNWSDRCESWIYGGALDPEIMKLSDQELIQLLKREREFAFGEREEFSDLRIVRWPQAIPHYSTKLEALLPSLEAEMSKTPNLFLHGNYLGGIGLSKILVRTDQLKEKILHG